MKVLIITQSSENGLNRKVALECSHIADDFIQDSALETKIMNASDVKSNDLSEFSHVIMVVPEWNGSFPHTFKAMIDDAGYPSAFKKKKILLIGTSDSSFGNIMGISHLEHILQWVGAFVDSKRICINNIRDNVDEFSVYDHEMRMYKAIRKFLK
jgi:NAD(P)H-dependent FMN reductase